MTSAKGDFVFGRHIGIDSLKSKSADKINKVFLQNGVQVELANQVYDLAKKKHLIVQRVPRDKFGRLVLDANHQDLVPTVSSSEYVDLDRSVRKTVDKENPSLLMLNSTEDPRNLGSILRSASAVGVDGAIIPKRRAGGLTNVAAKTSTGVTDHVPVCRVNNLVQTTKELKKANYWFFGTAMEEQNYRYWDAKGKCVLVTGNEGKGISPLPLKQMDQALIIPMVGYVQSLNASVVTDVLLHQILDSKMPLSK